MWFKHNKASLMVSIFLQENRYLGFQTRTFPASGLTSLGEGAYNGDTY